MAAHLVESLVVLMADSTADSMAVLKADPMDYQLVVHSVVRMADLLGPMSAVQMAVDLVDNLVVLMADPKADLRE